MYPMKPAAACAGRARVAPLPLRAGDPHHRRPEAGAVPGQSCKFGLALSADQFRIELASRSIFMMEQRFAQSATAVCETRSGRKREEESHEGDRCRKQNHRVRRKETIPLRSVQEL
jgi:hypothetical protein